MPSTCLPPTVYIQPVAPAWFAGAQKRPASVAHGPDRRGELAARSDTGPRSREMCVGAKSALGKAEDSGR